MSASHGAEPAPVGRGALLVELAARWALFALAVAFPLVTLPAMLLGGSGDEESALLGESAPAPPPPAWVHLVIVTTGRGPDAVTRAGAPELWRWRDEAAIATELLLPGTSAAANAATLWTGRWPQHHGVVSDELALVGTPWTLAEAVRIGGAHTAALLEAPFASATRIGGFQTLVEEPELEPVELAAALERSLDGVAGGRLLLWVHLAEAPAPRLDATLATLRAGLEARGLWPETLAVLVPLGPREDAAAWVRFPAVDWGGRRGDAALGLPDLTALLRSVLRVAPPDPLAQEAPIQGEASLALDVLRGWDADARLEERRAAAARDGAPAQEAAVPLPWRERERW